MMTTAEWKDRRAGSEAGDARSARQRSGQQGKHRHASNVPHAMAEAARRAGRSPR